MSGLQTFGLWALAFAGMRAPAPCATLAGHGGRFSAVGRAVFSYGRAETPTAVINMPVAPPSGSKGETIAWAL